MLPTILNQVDLGVSALADTGFFILVHLVLLLVGAYFAYRAFTAEADAGMFAWGFTFFVLAEVSYLTYHLEATTFLLAHTVAEVLDAVAFVLIFVGVSRHLLTVRRTAASTTRA